MGPDNDFEIKASEIRLKLVNNNVDGLLKEEVENDLSVLNELSTKNDPNQQITLNKLRMDYERVAQRAELLRQHNINGNNPTFSNRPAGSLEMMNVDEDRIARTHLLAIETQNLGEAVLEDLRRQREQIWHTNQALQQTDGAIDHSNVVMRDMWRRAQMNRWVTNAILILMLIIILLVLYLKIK